MSCWCSPPSFREARYRSTQQIRCVCAKQPNPVRGERVWQDIFLGYAHYAPGTLVIKGVMALVAALMYEKMGRTATSRIAGGVVSEIIMVLGYFGYASLLLGKGLAAAASIPGNIFQGVVGLVVGVLLVTVLERAKVTEKLA